MGAGPFGGGNGEWGIGGERFVIPCALQHEMLLRRYGTHLPEALSLWLWVLNLRALTRAWSG